LGVPAVTVGEAKSYRDEFVRTQILNTKEGQVALSAITDEFKKGGDLRSTDQLRSAISARFNGSEPPIVMSQVTDALLEALDRWEHQNEDHQIHKNHVAEVDRLR